jgi:hypothetical protein
MMVAEWELWAIATKLVDQHGDGARDEALRRQRALDARGDGGGVNVWAAILARIDQLQASPSGPPS